MMNSDRIAWVFPGQGASAQELRNGLAVIAQLPEADISDDLCRTYLGHSLDELMQHNDKNILSNRKSSLITTLISLALVQHIMTENSLEAYRAPKAVAGYSVGQWAAMYAAGLIDKIGLLNLVDLRARRMNAAIDGSTTAMIGVIGIAQDKLEAICAARREVGGRVWISNYNSIANFSVAGAHNDIKAVEEAVKSLGPKMVSRLPVAGAWHCPYLNKASDQFRCDLDLVVLSDSQMRIIDNTSGDWLPEEGSELRDRLARHLSEPVLWSSGIQTMIADGVTQFIEIGLGRSISTFGMFLDRSVKHLPLTRLHPKILVLSKG